MKKTLLLITVIYFLALFAVPCYMIYDYHDILSTGETYKIRVGAYDPYDPFRGRYVAIRPLLTELRWGGENIYLVKDTEDFVVAAEKTDDTNALGYVKKLNIERYYMNEKTAPLVEAHQRKAIAEGDLVYVIIKVKNGRYAIEGLYINGIAAEDFVK
ncbi:MAG: GDYXXLXY domain-containing protein [Clostridiales bacterium]|nr:GDYXXLXY domain-containing protein [Clostridiales bacterium]